MGGPARRDDGRDEDGRDEPEGADSGKHKESQPVAAFGGAGDAGHEDGPRDGGAQAGTEIGHTAGQTGDLALKAVAEEGPAPPLKGASPHAQRAAEPALGANADPAQVMRHLEKATSGAIARTELMQLASLPDAPRADGEVTRTQSWLFEMPVATPHGPAVAQFEIEKDGGGGADAEARSAAVWRTRFSVDVEPLGLIHALVTLNGGKTAVTLWAERRESLTKLRAAQAELAGTLEGEVAVYPGRPQAPAPREGRFLDSQS